MSRPSTPPPPPKRADMQIRSDTAYTESLEKRIAELESEVAILEAEAAELRIEIETR